jgi:hypothetical protein
MSKDKASNWTFILYDTVEPILPSGTKIKVFRCKLISDVKWECYVNCDSQREAALKKIFPTAIDFNPAPFGVRDVDKHFPKNSTTPAQPKLICPGQTGQPDKKQQPISVIPDIESPSITVYDDKNNGVPILKLPQA